MDNLRYSLSAALIDWGIRILPDEYTKACMKLGVQYSVALLEGTLEEVEEMKQKEFDFG